MVSPLYFIVHVGVYCYQLMVSESASLTPLQQINTVQNNNNIPSLRRQQQPHHRRSLQSQPPAVVQKYQLWKPEEIQLRLFKWADHYPNLVSLTTAQEKYGLPTAGGPNDCPYEVENDGCLNYILTIQDFITHPEGSESSQRLPEVLWSGELHGNERVGPTAVLEATELLLRTASCEALPTVASDRNKDPSSINEKEWDLARTCRQELYDFGINDDNRKWLARLVSTRRIVVVPTANALGYFQNKREENRIDPNRDFPYDQRNPKECMQTIAGRTLNEIFREHLFQLALTFHGGMEVVAYEWGAPTWEGMLSPDHVAQHAIASIYSQFAGKFDQTFSYRYGTMNELVYPVEGGMEDWAYAGSWDPDRVIQCEPTTFGGNYPKGKTVYNNSTLRVFNMLVETSDAKIPPMSQLGTSIGLLERGNPPASGHVTRNIRLALMSAELVEPYISFQKIHGLRLTDDVVPLRDTTDPRSCTDTAGVRVGKQLSKIAVSWIVGGSLTVDETKLYYAKWNDVPQLDCWSQPDEAILNYFNVAPSISSPIMGSGRFAAKGPTIFSAEVDLSPFTEGDDVVLIAVAIVDQDWKQQPEKFAPGLPPQSHIVNVRTNPNWYHESNGNIIQGRLKWFSYPITVQFDSNYDVAIQELRPHFSDTESQEPGGFEADDSSTTKQHYAAFVFVVVFAFTIIGVVWTTTQGPYRNYGRARVRQFSDDEYAFSPEMRQGNGQHNDGYTDDAPEYSNGKVEMSKYNRHSV